MSKMEGARDHKENVCVCACVCTSITDSSISGALEPSAMRVRLDTVSFQIRTVATEVSPLGMVMVTSFSCGPKHTGSL